MVPDAEQARRDFEPEALAESLKKRGRLTNVRGRFSAEHQKWIMIFSERRYRVALIAGITTLAEFVDHALSDAEKLEDALVENCLREDLNSVELAQAYERLMALRGYTAKDLAAELHVSPSAVSKTLAVLKLSPELQEKVTDGSLPKAVAYELSRLPSAAEQQAMAARVLGEGLTTERVAEAVQETKGRRNHAASKTGRRIACTLPKRGSVTVAAEAELTLEGVIELLSELLKVARKAKNDGKALEELPALLKGLAGGGKPRRSGRGKEFPQENADEAA